MRATGQGIAVISRADLQVVTTDRNAFTIPITADVAIGTLVVVITPGNIGNKRTTLERNARIIRAGLAVIATELLTPDTRTITAIPANGAHITVIAG
jgi:hypothetical protein